MLKGFEVGKEYNIVLEDGQNLEGMATTVTSSYVEFSLVDGRVLSIQEVKDGHNIIILKGERNSDL